MCERARISLEAGIASLPAINQAVDLDPRLAETLTFMRCAALAERLLGRPVEHRFDHAIYKPAFNGAATSWHQDEAYALERKIVSVHFWVPLQDVTRDMGCMEFIPGSHRGALGRRHRRDRRPGAHALELVGLDTSRAVACPIRAGAATVHVPRTVHYTGPNRTGTPPGGVGARVRSAAWPRGASAGESAPPLAPHDPLIRPSSVTHRAGRARRRASGRACPVAPGASSAGRRASPCESRVFWVLRRLRR